MNKKELNKLIDITMQRLPERTREIFQLNRFHGLAYKEIAQKLSISIKTVEANMGKALKVFRKALTEFQQVS
jgi:RNA polymerase sigma-70 factor (ECF subfamily)